MVSKTVQRLNPGVDFGREVRFEESETYTTERERREASDALNEATFQATCEAWLRNRGYAPRTPKRMQDHHTGLWYIHIHKAKANPIILDLLLLNSHTGRYLEIELKIEGGALTPDQRALVSRGEGCVCWTFDEFKWNVQEWERDSL